VGEKKLIEKYERENGRKRIYFNTVRRKRFESQEGKRKRRSAELSLQDRGKFDGLSSLVRRVRRKKGLKGRKGGSLSGWGGQKNLPSGPLQVDRLGTKRG